MTRSIFVTGTDTGVGKTVVSCALLRALRAAGVRVAGLKPVETGVGPDGPLDALALREAAGSPAALEEVCSQRFAMPAAPNVAAAAEGREVDLSAIRAAFDAAMTRHDAVVVEGAGGLLVPLTRDTSMADLMGELGSQVLLVARGALGTINHTLLSLAEIERRQLPLAGVVISHPDGPLSQADDANLDALRIALGERLVAEIEPLDEGARARHDSFRKDWLERVIAASLRSEAPG